MNFKDFILNESHNYFGQKIGDILTALHELKSDSKNMGSRDLTRFSERIVNQIRRILHSQWPREEKKHLLTLQKVAVAIMKAIDEREDLPTVISGAAAEIEKLSGRLGVPINKLGAPDKAPEKEVPVGTAGPEQKSSAPNQPSPGPPSPPLNPPQDLNAAPLGGNSGPFTAF